MSLTDMGVDTTDALAPEALHNAINNYVVAALQAIDWEPDGYSRALGQVMRKGKRSFIVKVTLLEHR